MYIYYSFMTKNTYFSCNGNNNKTKHKSSFQYENLPICTLISAVMLIIKM